MSSSPPTNNDSLTEQSSPPLDIMRSASPPSERRSVEFQGVVCPPAAKQPQQLSPDLVNLDRLEKKKNREKRRRSEVNDRFNELVEVMDNAQSQMMNTPGYSNEFSKSILTKSDLLEKAVDLVKALADENKKLKLMVQGGMSSMPPMVAHVGHSVPFDPSHVYHQSWPATPQQIHPYGVVPAAMYAAQPPGPGPQMGIAPTEYQPQFMRAHAQHMIPPLALNKPNILSYADMAQLGDWGAVSAHSQGFDPQQQKQRYENAPPSSKVSSVTFQPTHAECA